MLSLYDLWSHSTSCVCSCSIGVCICHWRCRGGWRVSWQRSRGGHAWLLHSHSDCHHHKSGPAVDGATHPHLLSGTRAEWHRYDHHDPVGGPGPIRHARAKFLLQLRPYPSQLRHPGSLAPVTEPPAHTWRNGKQGSHWTEGFVSLQAEILSPSLVHVCIPFWKKNVYMWKCWKRFHSFFQLTPEEEEKRRVRRERNKLAAAKCRNRRRELTDRLQSVSS